MSFNSVSKKDIIETKSEYIKRPLQNRPKKQRTSVITNNNPILNNHTLNNKLTKKSSNFSQKSYSNDSQESSRNIQTIMKCIEHHKELDMVCEHPECMMSICSSCILFGKHKNHQYSQIENFFENIESMKENLKGVQLEVQKQKKSTIISHDSENLLKRIKNNRKKIEQNINNYCDKLIERISKKKK